MALDDIDALPAAADGITVSSAASAWGYGVWVELSASLSTDIYIISVLFESTNIPALDTTIEQIIDVGVGAAGAESTKVQIPYTVRCDTQVSYYLTTPETIYLPEPYLISSGERVAIKVADSLAAAVTYNGVKLMYKEGASGFTPSDPFGMMGIFGI